MSPKCISPKLRGLYTKKSSSVNFATRFKNIIEAWYRAKKDTKRNTKQDKDVHNAKQHSYYFCFKYVFLDLGIKCFVRGLIELPDIFNCSVLLLKRFDRFIVPMLTSMVDMNAIASLKTNTSGECQI